MESARKNFLVISCEHAGNDVPPEYAALFEGREALLQTHRGWDPGALQLAREMAERFSAPLYWDTTTRLLIDLNLSIGLPRLFSEITRPLPRRERQAIVERYYRPHRGKVEGAIDALIASGRRVIHIASHSFTPVFDDGVVRRADVAWLYDPRRPGELAFSKAWMSAFDRRSPGLRLRRNYPYRGHSDGLTFCLRKRHAEEAYIGIELEVNQRFVAQGGPAWDALRASLVSSLVETVGAA